MKPKAKPQTKEHPLFGVRLELMLDPDHELVKLAQVIDWDRLAAEFGPLYAETGRPGIPIRTMAGLVLLQHTFKARRCFVWGIAPCKGLDSAPSGRTCWVLKAS